MLKIKIIAVLFGVNLSVSAQDYCAVLFDDIQLKTEFAPLSPEELMDLCTRQSGNFDQPVFTYGSEDPADWLRVSECVQRYSKDMQPEGRWLDINGDEYLDLVISFLAGYEYTFVAFYLQHANTYTCVHSGVGEFYGKQADASLVYVDPSCCDDPTHEFYVLGQEEESWKLRDSFSVTNAYSSGFPTPSQFSMGSEGYQSQVEIAAVGASGKKIHRFPAGSGFRLIHEIEGDGHFLYFAEAHWEGNDQFLPKVYCWIEVPE